MAWRIEFHPQAERELSKLDRDVARRILQFLKDRVATLEDPRSLGEALKGPEVGRFWKYRVGNYRLICDIRDQSVSILVVRIGNRGNIYR